MVLPLVDFVDLQDLPAVTAQVPVGSGTVRLTVRTYNEESASHGQRTMAVDLPADLSLPRGRWSCDLEVFVLSGELEVEGQVLERYGYLFVPAGVLTGPVSVSGETRILVFASDLPSLTPAETDAPGAPRHRVVGPVHVGDVAWEKPKTEGFPAGAGRKTLRIDPETHEGFWILGVLPHWTSPVLEWHDFDEENVILEGEIQTAEGLMTPGSYLAHPAGEHTVHGPMRSRTGSLLITRSVGPFGTTYADAPEALGGPWR